jgi:hypothetical protein
MVQEYAAEPVIVIADAILDCARRYAGGALRDDAAIVVVRHE